MSTATSLPAAALPIQLTAFVGREGDVETLRRLLAESRLLTLTGVGGSGKTRLALATVARMHAAGEADVAWVELASLSDPGQLATHLALSLGARAEGGGTFEQAAVAILREHPLLLVLDNCEHLVDACAQLVDRLLRACPGLRVLATSREALGIGGERSWLVPPLSLPPASPGDGPGGPSPEEALAAESVRLFVERARDVVPAFELTASNVGAVAHICRRLDGLPLGIELAAARVGVLTPAQIAERLDDRFELLTTGARSALPRHRTLRGAVDWSYELLSSAERRLLGRLSVFAGGFTLEAAEQVCPGGEIAPSAVLDLLASLVTRSLVSMQESEGRARYRLLETIREYAGEKLTEGSDAADVAARHAAYFAGLASAAAEELQLGRPARLQQMDTEQDNLLAALEWSAGHGAGATVGLPLCWGLMWYWFHRQLWRDGFRHFERALATATDPEPGARAAALHGLALFGLYVREPGSGERLAEAERIWRATGNRRWLAFTLLVRTVEASLRGDAAEARAFADEAVSVSGALGDEWVVALTTAHALVPVLVWEGDWAAADEALVDAERAYRAHDYEIGVAYVLDARAFVTFQLGDLARAAELAHASLRLAPDRENRWLAGRSLRVLAAVAHARGDHVRAARLFGAADAMYEAIGARSLTAERRAVNELPERVREAMGAEAYDGEAEAGARLTFAEALRFALADDAREDVEAASATAEASPIDASQAEASEAAASVADAVLRVRALGPLEVTAFGRPVPPEAWSYAKPRELLLYLLAHPEGRTREQVGLAFWPDASQAQVKNNFHVTLHHVRKAIGVRKGGPSPELIRYEKGRYRVAFEEGVDFDVARFEQEVPALLRHLRGSRDADVLERLERTLALHRGAFLESEPAGDWHLEVRDRVSRLHEDAVLALGAGWDAVGEPGRAADAYRRLVALDPLHEHAVRCLARALVAEERRADALRALERLERDLATELGAEPEAETRELAAALRRGRGQGQGS